MRKCKICGSNDVIVTRVGAGRGRTKLVISSLCKKCKSDLMRKAAKARSYTKKSETDEISI